PEADARLLTEIKDELVKTMATAPVKVNAATAKRAAEANDVLRAEMGEWFAFYNGYDPAFTWWVPMPQKELDKTLQDYSAFLRDKAADAGAPVAPATVAAIAAVPTPKYSSIPDLAEIIALPQDEMRDI